MRRLAFLAGSWDIRIEGLDRAGTVIHESVGRLDTQSELGGQLLVSLGFAPNASSAQRNWKFYSRPRQKLYDVNFDLAGNFEVREDVSEGDDLSFALVDPFRGTDGVARNWRKSYRRVSPDVYVVLTHYSEEPATWVLAFRETFTRRGGGGGDAGAAAGQRGPMTKGERHARLEPFIGRWSTQPVRPGSREPLPGQGQSVFEWTVGDVWLRETLSMEIPGVGTRHQLTLITHDAAQDRYVGSWQDNLTPRVWPFTATWAEPAVLECEDEFDVGGRRIRLRVRYDLTTPDEIRMTQSQAVDGGPLQDVFAVDMRREKN
jgi:hypothetical protein